MSPSAIVSYDDTLNDHDALALARVLNRAGATLTLAYVRHTAQIDAAREQLEEHEAEALLARGARLLGDLEVRVRVVLSASTGEGLKWLAERERADIVVFGSDYRTPPGHVAPQHSTQTLLQGGPAALAIAPASYRSRRDPHIRTIGALPEAGDDAALQTAYELGERLGAAVAVGQLSADLLVVGSRAEAPAGRVMITARAQNAIENAVGPVLVTGRATPVRFVAPVAAL
jgi:nucleotide-binding universal stress UspA family protein